MEIPSLCIKYHKNGSISINEIKNKRIKFCYYSNTQCESICHYNKNGKLHGTYKSWFINGSPYIICRYKNGELHGQYLKYLINNTIHLHLDFIHGKNVKDIEWWSNGKMATYSTPLVYKKWCQSGKLIRDVHYQKNGDIIHFMGLQLLRKKINRLITKWKK